MTHRQEQTAGRYRLVSLLGEGGMGKVYKAYDAVLERNVAIKILPAEVLTDPARVTRFVQEARAASALNHPHVMTVYDIGEERFDGGTEPVRYIAMELIDGKTLRDALDAGAVDLRKGVKIVMQVAEALTAAHAAGIIHRDLKPENIMVTTAGYAKVLDFGLAKLRVGEEPAETVSRTMVKGTDPGVVMGTAGYMSPEQALAKPADHRSDIFSLGCVLYELVTSRRAFRGDSSVDTLHKIIHTDPEPIRTIRSDAPQEVVRIVRKALAKDPDERYQTAKDLAIDLRELLREIDSNPSGATITAPAPVVPPRTRWLRPALVALLVVGAALIAALWPRRVEVAPQAPRSMKITRVTASGKVTGAAISPDGKFVAYSYSDQGEQSLWVRQMASGQSLQLIPQRRVAYWGMSFSPEGSIYFGLKGNVPPEDAIYQISPLGGAPRKIISVIDSQPAFSPDGKRMAFLRAAFPTQSESALMVANVDGSDARPLATRRSPELFAPIFYAGASWSPDGKLLAAGVMNYRDRKSRIVTIDIATGAIQPVGDHVWPQIGNVAWMPDQKGLIAIAGPGGGRNQVWYVPYPMGTPSQITNDLFDYRMATVTADGKSLVAVANDIAADLWVYQEGTAPRRLTSAKLEGAFGVDTLPDGRIVFASLESGKHDLWVMNGDGSGRTLLTRDEHRNTFPVATPDGHGIIYLSETSRRQEVCRMNLDGSGRRVLATAINNAFLAVSPDGKWIAYDALRDTGMPGIGRVTIDGGEPVLLTTDYFSSRPAYSPEGSRMAVYSQPKVDAPFTLAILHSDGRRIKTLESAPSFFFSAIRWTPDGNALIVNTAPSDRANLWLLPIDGSPPRRLTHFEERTIMAFAPLPGSKGWVLSRGDQARDAVLITGFRPE